MTVTPGESLTMSAMVRAGVLRNSRSEIVVSVWPVTCVVSVSARPVTMMSPGAAGVSMGVDATGVGVAAGAGASSLRNSASMASRWRSNSARRGSVDWADADDAASAASEAAAR